MAELQGALCPEPGVGNDGGDQLFLVPFLLQARVQFQDCSVGRCGAAMGSSRHG